MPIISLTPKDFVKGISPLQGQQNGFGGFFAQATSIDTYRYPGFISPGAKPKAFTNAASMTGICYGIGEDGTGNLYAMGDRFYRITGGNAIDGSAPFPHAYSSITAVNGYALDVILYALNGSKYIFYFSDTDIGRYDLSSTFVDTWGSTGGATGAGALNAGPHKAVLFAGCCYFTHGSYVGSIDGTTGTTYLNLTSKNSSSVGGALALPTGYIATDIKVVNGFLEITANSSNTTNYGKAIIIRWDGVSTLPQETTDIDDNTVTGERILGGFPHVFTQGRSGGLVLRKKNYWGYQPVQHILGQNAPTSSMIDTYAGMMAFGTPSSGNIYTYGTPFEDYSYRGTDNAGTFPTVLNSPFYSQTQPYVIKTVNKKLVVLATAGFATTFDPFDYSSTSAFDNGSASFQTNFIQLPDDTSVKSIRFYFLPIAANVAFTPSIFTDYATSGFTMPDATASTLDANGRSKTYTADQFQSPITDTIAIGGNWANSSVYTSSAIITRIDIEY